MNAQVILTKILEKRKLLPEMISTRCALERAPCDMTSTCSYSYIVYWDQSLSKVGLEFCTFTKYSSIMYCLVLLLKRIEKKTVKLHKHGIGIPILPQIDFDPIVKNGCQLFFHAYHVVPTYCGCILQSGSI